MHNAYIARSMIENIASEVNCEPNIDGHDFISHIMTMIGADHYYLFYQNGPERDTPFYINQIGSVAEQEWTIMSDIDEAIENQGYRSVIEMASMTSHATADLAASRHRTHEITIMATHLSYTPLLKQINRIDSRTDINLICRSTANISLQECATTRYSINDVLDTMYNLSAA